MSTSNNELVGSSRQANFHLIENSIEQLEENPELQTPLCLHPSTKTSPHKQTPWNLKRLTPHVQARHEASFNREP